MTPIRDEGFFSWRVSPEELDRLWSTGWRHFGPMFYRYAQALHGQQLMDVCPLRVRLPGFSPSKSQRRTQRRNADLTVRVQPASLDEHRRTLFHEHKRRFIENVPDSLEDFLGPDPTRGPCLTVEVGCYLGSRLIAASYLDVGLAAVSSVYALFDPDHEDRRLGVFTMLAEMQWATQRGCQFYYPGYCYLQPSHYDYKKQFAGLEWFDWKTWRTLDRGTEPLAGEGNAGTQTIRE